jgi:hypothetical protein
MRRVATFFGVAIATSGGLLFWLHDGDVRAALDESRTAVRWDADALAREAGIVLRDPPPSAPTGDVLRLDEPAGPSSPQ